MSYLKILPYTHKDLRKPTNQINQFDNSLCQMIAQIRDTMVAKGGWCLSAPQVGYPVRLFVLDIPGEQNQPSCLINPEILEKSGTVDSEEDSLSFPRVPLIIPRARQIKVRYQNEAGEEFVITAERLQACAIQHGIDYLNGILFIDHLSKLKRSRLLEKWQKNPAGESCGSATCGHHHH